MTHGNDHRVRLAIFSRFEELLEHFFLFKHLLGFSGEGVGIDEGLL